MFDPPPVSALNVQLNSDDHFDTSIASIFCGGFFLLRLVLNVTKSQLCIMYGFNEEEKKITLNLFIENYKLFDKARLKWWYLSWCT